MEDFQNKGLYQCNSQSYEVVLKPRPLLPYVKSDIVGRLEGKPIEFHLTMHWN